MPDFAAPSPVRIAAVIVAISLIALAGGPRALAQAPNPTVARPVDPDSSASSRVVVAVQPVGRVPYDGVTIPLVSPDGRFIVSQHGRTPSWETLLADRAQSVPVGLKLSTFQIDFAPPAAAAGEKPAESRPKPPTLAAAPLAEPFPPGLLLGRAADETGFLVEAPQADGARHIGRIRWLSAKVEWLAKDDRVNAHAVLAPHVAGDRASWRIAFVRRDLTGRAFSLVLRTRSDSGESSESVYSSPDRSQSFLFPIFSPDGGTLAAFAISADDGEASATGPLELVAFDLTSPEHGLHPCGRIDLGRAGAGLHSAFQCVAAIQAPATLPAVPEGHAPNLARDLFARGLLFFSPRDAAMVWWLPQEHHLLTLASGSFAAAPFQHADFGFLIAGPSDRRNAKPGHRPVTPPNGGGLGGELTYQPLMYRPGAEGSDPTVGRQVDVLSSQSLPRATNRTGGISLLLAAPRAGDQDAFDVLLLAPAKPE